MIKLLAHLVNILPFNMLICKTEALPFILLFFKIDFYSIKDRDIDFAKKALTNLQNEFENEIAECQL